MKEQEAPPCQQHRKPCENNGDVNEPALIGFEDLSTLHALIYDPIDRTMVGAEFVLSGIKHEDVEAAKGFFLRYSGDEPLERTPIGEVLRRPASTSVGCG